MIKSIIGLFAAGALGLSIGGGAIGWNTGNLREAHLKNLGLSALAEHLFKQGPAAIGAYTSARGLGHYKYTTILQVISVSDVKVSMDSECYFTTSGFRVGPVLFAPSYQETCQL